MKTYKYIFIVIVLLVVLAGAALYGYGVNKTNAQTKEFLASLENVGQMGLLIPALR